MSHDQESQVGFCTNAWMDSEVRCLEVCFNQTSVWMGKWGCVGGYLSHTAPAAYLPFKASGDAGVGFPTGNPR